MPSIISKALSFAVCATGVISTSIEYCTTQPASKFTHVPNKLYNNELVFMHWNAEFLFSPTNVVNPFLPAAHTLPKMQCPSSRGFPHGCEWKNNNELSHHISAVADVIGSTRPHIINLSEVQGCNVMQQVADEIANKRIIPNANQRYVPFSVPSHETFTGQTVGFMSLLPPTAVSGKGKAFPVSPIRRHLKTAGKPPSKTLVTGFKIPGLQRMVMFISVHLASNPSDGKRAIGRGKVMRHVALAAKDMIAKGHHVIIAGDFNEYDGHHLARDASGNVPPTKLNGVDVLRNIAGLRNVMETGKVPTHQRYTLKPNQHPKCALDQVFVDPALYHKISHVEIMHTFDPKGFLPGGANKQFGHFHSDHFPIIVKFRV